MRNELGLKGTRFGCGGEDCGACNGARRRRDNTCRHVRHAVGGSEQVPLNLWDIVLLTDAPDPRYCEPFKQMVRAGLLPGFIEIYIERDLKLKLSRI
jgi:hypothetical protein